jgi:hypothetical protein
VKGRQIDVDTAPQPHRIAPLRRETLDREQLRLADLGEV